MTENTLEPLQIRFCEEFLIDGIAKKAYVRAGYSMAGAQENSSRLMADPRIKAKIKELQDSRAERLGITADRVLQELARVGFANLESFVTQDEEGNTDVNLGIEQGRPIGQVSVTTVNGKNKTKSINVKTITTADKIAALMQIGKHLGMFKEQVEVSGQLSLAELVEASFLKKEDNVPTSGD